MKMHGLFGVVKNPRRGHIPKTLEKKVNEVVDHLTKAGAPKKDFDPLRRALSDLQRPLSIQLLHSYVHNLFAIPKTRDILASWDEARPYFQRIWA